MNHTTTPDSFALIVGAMRSGTTSLFYYLSEHPEIAPSREKEPLFFCDDTKLARGLDWYLSLWDWNPEVHTFALEASSNYTMQPLWPNTAERISYVAEDFQLKFIYLLRHPLRRIESHLSFLASAGDLDTSDATIPDECVAYSRYAMQIQPYVDTFGRENIFFLTLESLERDPQTQLRAICEFLHIDPTYRFTRTSVSRNTRETLNMHPFIHRIRHNTLVEPIVEMISPAIRQQLRGYLQRSKVRSTALSERDQVRLSSELQEDVNRLHTDYGINVERDWGFSL